MFYKTAKTLEYLEEKSRNHAAERDGNPSLNYNKIYAPPGRNLGDCWAFISYVVKNRLPTITDLGSDKLFRRYAEILELLDIKHNPQIVQSSGISAWSFNHEYVPTKKKWEPDLYHRRICYQFDGQSSAPAKNMSSAEEQQLINMLESLGMECCRLGKHLTLRECVEVAATSDLFVGVDSGMSHLCHSVGVPIFIIQNKLSVDFIKKYHSHNNYVLHNLDEILFLSLSNFINDKKYSQPSVQRQASQPYYKLVAS